MWILMLVVLALLAVVFLLFARKQQLSTLSTLQANKAVFESRQAEIEEDAKQGLLSNKDLANARRELEKTFVTDVHDPDEQVVMKPAPIIWVMAVVLLLATALYWQDGSWQQQREADQARAELEERSRVLLSDSSGMVDQEEMWLFALGLRQRLQEQPDAAAWSLYGRIMIQLSQLEQAIEAFEQSRQLAPNNASNLVLFAQALIMSGSDPDLARAARYVRQVLEATPTNVEALGLLGIIAYERGDFSRAAEAWRITLQLLDDNDPRAASLERSLADAQARADGSILTLTVNVDISETLRNEMPFGATLFVFVRDPDGGRAPIAVERVAISDFPTTVTLTNDSAMTPDRKLSDVENWLVGARLSASGSIDIRSGDMEARPVLVEAAPGRQVNLRITEFLP